MAFLCKYEFAFNVVTTYTSFFLFNVVCILFKDKQVYTYTYIL